MPQTVNVPQAIPLSKVQDFVADLGIDPADLRELVIGVDGVEAEVYARDEHGRFYMNGNEVALHRISIRLDLDAAPTKPKVVFEETPTHTRVHRV